MLNIKQINKDLAVNFVKRYHYSKIMPHSTKYYLGFFSDKDVLCGKESVNNNELE